MNIEKGIFQMEVSHRLHSLFALSLLKPMWQDSRIIFGNWVEDGETDTLFELLHASLYCWKSYQKTSAMY